MNKDYDDFDTKAAREFATRKHYTFAGNWPIYETWYQKLWRKIKSVFHRPTQN